MLLTVAHAVSQTITIDFEALRGIHFNSGTPIADFAAMSNQLAGSHGVIFRSQSDSPYVAVVNLGNGHATSGTNGIGGVAGDVLSYSTPVRMQFVLPSDPNVAAITDFVCLRNDLLANSGGIVRIDAFGLDGSFLATASAVDDHPFTLCLTNPGIHSVIVTGPTQNGAALDDISFTPTAPPPTNALPVRLFIQSALAIQFPTESNRLYQVEWSSPPDTNTWHSLGPVIFGDGRTSTAHDLKNNRSYRVVPQ